MTNPVASGARALRPCAAADTGAVTMVLSRRVPPGQDAEYERYLELLHSRAHGVRGYLGTEVVRDASAHEYVSIVRFDSWANLRSWQASGELERWQVMAGVASVNYVDGIELWFDVSHARAQAPSRHKMALVLTVLVTMLSLVLTPLIQHLAGAPRPLRVLVGATLQVMLLTYVIMPRVTRLLAFWLFPPSPGQPAGSRYRPGRK